MSLSWEILVDPDAVAAIAAKHILQSADAAIAERAVFRLVLAGGRTPEATYRLLADGPAHWPAWEIFFGDERCLPASDSLRNSQMLASALTERIPIPRSQVHVIPAELGPEGGARSYAKLLKDAMPFDLVVHGLGEDGHTASLFPGRPLDGERLVVGVCGAPKPPSERVSLGMRSLRATREALVIATGNGKRSALTRWLQGDPSLPIAQICRGVPCRLVMDRAAAPTSL